MTKVSNFTENVYHAISVSYNFLLLAHFQTCYKYCHEPLLYHCSVKQGILVPKALVSCKFRPDHV